MIFKNLLFGFGGTAVIGVVGYGIYASSQANDEDKTTTTGDSDSKNEPGLSEDKDDDVSKTQEDEGKSNDTQGKDSEESSVTGSSGETPGGSVGGPGAQN